MTKYKAVLKCQSAGYWPEIWDENGPVYGPKHLIDMPRCHLGRLHIDNIGGFDQIENAICDTLLNKLQGRVDDEVLYTIEDYRKWVVQRADSFGQLSQELQVDFCYRMHEVRNQNINISEEIDTLCDIWKIKYFYRRHLSPMANVLTKQTPVLHEFDEFYDHRLGKRLERIGFFRERETRSRFAPDYVYDVDPVQAGVDCTSFYHDVARILVAGCLSDIRYDFVNPDRAHTHGLKKWSGAKNCRRLLEDINILNEKHNLGLERRISSVSEKIKQRIQSEK